MPLRRSWGPIPLVYDIMEPLRPSRIAKSWNFRSRMLSPQGISPLKRGRVPVKSTSRKKDCGGGSAIGDRAGGEAIATYGNCSGGKATMIERDAISRVQRNKLRCDADRLNAFSDEGIAVIIRLIVLGLKAPSVLSSAALVPLWPAVVSHALSYLFIPIIWVNHRHLMRFVVDSTTRLIWNNSYIYFW